MTRLRPILALALLCTILAVPAVGWGQWGPGHRGGLPAAGGGCTGLSLCAPLAYQSNASGAGGTSGAINTTGATEIIAIVNYFCGGSITTSLTDSKSNS